MDKDKAWKQIDLLLTKYTMDMILISMLSGLVINLITYLSGKFNVSKTYVSVGLSIFLWVVLYVWQMIINKYPLQWEQIVWFASWAYAMSQCVYSLFKKWWISLK